MPKEPEELPKELPKELDKNNYDTEDKTKSKTHVVPQTPKHKAESKTQDPTNTKIPIQGGPQATQDPGEQQGQGGQEYDAVAV